MVPQGHFSYPNPFYVSVCFKHLRCKSSLHTIKINITGIKVLVSCVKKSLGAFHSTKILVWNFHKRTGNFLPGGRGGGGKPFAQKHLASCPNFYERVEKNMRAIFQQHRPSWHMKVARYSFSGSIPSLSINYVAINKHLESCIKMKSCHHQGCNDIGVVIATKWLHYLFYFSNDSRDGNLTKSFTGAFFANTVFSMFANL